MKKRLMCLILVFAFVLPLILTSCGDDMTPEEIANANFQKAEKALTLSFWLPVPDSVASKTAEDDKNENGLNDVFDTRLAAMQDKFNDYLRTNNYSTEIDFVAVAESEYYAKLSERFEDIKELELAEGTTAAAIANKYVNKAEKDEVTGLFKLSYPDVLDNQLDIFFVGGYDNYINFIESGDTKELNSFFTEGQIFNGLFKKVRKIFFDATKVNNNYYGIPNNHVFSESGQCILVNKELFDSVSEVKWDEDFDLFSLKDFINKVGSLGNASVIPFVGKSDDYPGVFFFDKENMIATTPNDITVNSETGEITYKTVALNDLQVFKDYVAFYKYFNEKSYVSSAVPSGKTAAVQIYNGNLVDVENIDDYYVIETLPPFASIETVYESMFAISTHSANYQRAMEMLYLLQENEELRTLLQYGIVEQDYELGSVNGETVLINNNSGYEMNLLYTGNCYRTYPDYGVPMSAWEDTINYNLSTQLHPFMKVQFAYINGKIKEDDIAILDGYKEMVLSVNSEIMQMVNDMTYAEVNAYFSYKNKNNAKKAMQASQTAYDEALAAYNAASDAEKQLLKSELDELALELANNTASYNYFDVSKTEKSALDKLIKTYERLDLRDAYFTVYTNYNK